MVLSQRTGKRAHRAVLSGDAGGVARGSQKILDPPNGSSNPKSKLPFNVSRAGPTIPASPATIAQLLANAGREEATPVVEATAPAHLADARPGKDESSVRTPPPAVPLAEVGSGPASASGKRPPLSLIRPEAGAAGKEAEKAITESARVRRSSSSSKAAPLPPPPPVTTTQENPPSGSTPPAPVQGEPALGASQSGVPMAIDAMPSQAAAAPSARPSNRNKLIMGAAALLAVSLTVFAVTRSSGSKLDAVPTVAQEAPTSTAPAPAPAAEPTAPIAALPSATGTAPTETRPRRTAARPPSPRRPPRRRPAAAASRRARASPMPRAQGQDGGRSP